MAKQKKEEECSCKDVSLLDKTANILVIIGALNWGLVGFFNWNLVDKIFGVGSLISSIIYALVGLAGLYMVYYIYKMMK